MVQAAKQEVSDVLYLEQSGGKRVKWGFFRLILAVPAQLGDRQSDPEADFLFGDVLGG